MGFECVSRTHVGLKRKANEDSLMIRTERGLWAVADGMGGHEAGDVASGRIAEALQHLPIVYDVDELIEAASAALKAVNHDLIQLARGDGIPRTIGSTVVAVAIAGTAMRCLWAGDSRAYRMRGGRLTQLTQDHSLVQELVNAGMLQPEAAHDHPQANVVTRAVGVSEALRLDVVAGDAQPGDLFLIASDGLTRVVPDPDLADEMACDTLDTMADRLVDLVLQRGAPDNVSLILVRCL
jgi:serine/threonine-protein phosphatase Stp1